MEIPDIITADETNFDFQVLDFSERLPVVVDFWAKWGKECQRISTLLENLAAEQAGRFRLARVDVDGSPRLSQGYQIHSIPTLKIFINGQVFGNLEGLWTDLQVVEFVKKYVPGPEGLLLKKAASYLEDEQYLSVEDTCLEILEEDPDNPSAKLLLSKSLLFQGEYLEAVTLLSKFPASREFQAAEKLAPLAEQLLALSALDRSGAPLDAVYQRALYLIEDGNIPASLDGLLEILKVDKNYRDGQARKVILGLFELLGEDHILTAEYRSQLASTLF